MKLKERIRYYLLRKLDAVDAIHYRRQRNYSEVLEHEVLSREKTIKVLSGDIERLREKCDSLYKSLWPLALKKALADLEQVETREASNG